MRNEYTTPGEVGRVVRLQPAGDAEQMAAGPVLWLTGLSGAGKSSLAGGATRILAARGIHAVVIDGDALRTGLSSDLGFSQEDRAENVRRAAEVAAICSRARHVTYVALISPLQQQRVNARRIVGPAFHEVFVNADFATCKARDTKGLYRRAEQGELANFTGMDSSYEAPNAPDFVVNTARQNVQDSVLALVAYTLAVCPNSLVKHERN